MTDQSDLHLRETSVQHGPTPIVGTEGALVDAHMHIFPAVVRPSGVASLTMGRIRDEDGRIVQLMPPSFERSRAPVEVALATMDLAGVERALLIGGPTYGIHDEYVAGVLHRWPNRFAALTTFKAHFGLRAADDLERWIADHGFAGVKLEIPETRRIWGIDVDLLGDAEMRAWERCATLGGLLMIHLDPGASQCAAVRRVADAFPALRIIVAHLGQPPSPGWQDQVRLARHPRIYLDCSALPWFFRDREEYPFPSARAALEWAVREVGAGKIMWGSDFPSNLLFGTYAQLLGVVTGAPGLTTEERAALSGRTASTVLTR